MESKIMGETRELQIILPDNFSKKKSYSVIYVTDGEKRTTMTKSITDFIKYAKMMPESIIVGIINIDRSRDFTPTNTGFHKTSGNAGVFIKYLEEEVKPYVIANYGINNKHILTGHSLGGLFAMYTLLTKAELFDGYVASDPSFWWDNEFINEFAKTKLPTLKGKQHILYINGRDGEPMKGMGIANMKEMLGKYAPKNLDWIVKSYPDETHTSVVLKGYYDGLRFVEEDYVNDKIIFHPRNVNYVKGNPVMLFLDGGAENVYYTLNGNEPTKEAMLYNNVAMINEEAVFKFKKITKRSQATKAKEIAIKLATPVVAEKINPKKLKKGLKYKYYEDITNKSLINKETKPAETGVLTNSFGLKKFSKDKSFVCKYDGYFEAKTTGYHYFLLDADDDFQLYLKDQLLLDFNKKRDARLKSSAVVYLKKGMHKIKINYSQKEKNKKINLQLYMPIIMKNGPKKVSFNSFFYKK